MGRIRHLKWPVLPANRWRKILATTQIMDVKAVIQFTYQELVE